MLAVVEQIFELVTDVFHISAQTHRPVSLFLGSAVHIESTVQGCAYESHKWRAFYYIKDYFKTQSCAQRIDKIQLFVRLPSGVRSLISSLHDQQTNDPFDVCSSILLTEL